MNHSLSPIKNNLMVSGFDTQSIVSIKQLKQAVNCIPDAHLQGLQIIKFDPNRNIQKIRAYYDKTWQMSASAEYLNAHQSVVLYQFKSLEDFHHILYHEIGHFVFYKIISSFLKKEWVTQIYPNSSKITAYASRNASEDFAESYAYFIHSPDELRKLPSKYYFLKQKIFSL